MYVSWCESYICLLLNSIQMHTTLHNTSYFSVRPIDIKKRTPHEHKKETETQSSPGKLIFFRVVTYFFFLFAFERNLPLLIRTTFFSAIFFFEVKRTSSGKEAITRQSENAKMCAYLPRVDQRRGEYKMVVRLRWGHSTI